MQANSDHFNPIFIQDQKCYLQNVSSDPIALWDIGLREQLAHTNVVTALNNLTNQEAIFVGIEHLPALQHLWPQNHKAIVIEKYKNYAACYLAKINYKNLDNIILVEGGDEIIDASAVHGIVYENYFTTTMVGICLKLFFLELHWDKCAQYFIAATEQEIIFEDLFHRMFFLIQVTKQFHHTMQTRYEALNSNDLNENNVTYLMVNKDDYDMTRWFQHLLADKTTHLFHLNYADLRESKNKFPIHNYHHDQAASLQKLHVSMDFAHALLNHLEEVKPAAVLLRCLTLFSGLEEVLFLGYLLSQLKIAKHVFFADPFNHYSVGHYGAWIHHFYFKYFWDASSYCYQCDVTVAQLYAPETIALRYYTINYFQDFNGKTSFLPAQTEREKLIYDLVILHWTRVDEISFLQQEWQELFAIIKNAGTEQPLSKKIFNFCYGMRQLITSDKSLNQQEWGLLLGSMEWFFFIFYRIYQVKEICNRWGKQYRIKVFGDSWEQFLPAEFCGGLLTTREQVYRTLNQAYFVVNTYPNTGWVQPHHNVLECLIAGSMPLTEYPVYQLSQADMQFSHPFLHGDNLVYFRDFADLGKKLDHYGSDIKLRNNYIANAQAQLEIFQEDLIKIRLQDVQQNIVRQAKPSLIEMPITHNPAWDAALLKIGMGYLHYFRGYQKYAVQLWKEALAMGFESEVIRERVKNYM